MTRIADSQVDLQRFLGYTGTELCFRAGLRNLEDTVVFLQMNAVALLR